MKDYLQLSFHNTTDEAQDILIAYLAEAGYEGFEQNDSTLHAYIPVNLYDESFLQELIHTHRISCTKTIIPARNWNLIWESSIEPVIIDDFLCISSHFHKPVQGVKHEITITPKMSFGTGHHATTRLMLLQMQEINFLHKRVLDFGTGTGILAILAEKLGASYVTAIDNDEWSIINATENIKQNSCSKIHLYKSDSVIPDEPYEIILANINRKVIIENLPVFREYIIPEGVLLLSGILREEEDMIRQKAAVLAFQLVKKSVYDDWLSLRFIC